MTTFFANDFNDFVERGAVLLSEAQYIVNNEISLKASKDRAMSNLKRNAFIFASQNRAQFKINHPHIVDAFIECFREECGGSLTRATGN